MAILRPWFETKAITSVELNVVTNKSSYLNYKWLYSEHSLFFIYMFNSAQKSKANTLPAIVCTLVVKIAAELDSDGEDGDEDVGEDVPCVEEGEELPGLSMAVRASSEANWADTPEELVQVDGGVPFPSTKFTTIH